MTLTVENGTGVANANSYVDLDDARTFAVARGYAFTDQNKKLEQYLIGAMDYLETFRDRYKGVKTDSTYALQWPRYGVSIDGTAIESNVIPVELVQAQIRLAMALQDGVELMPTSTGSPFVKRRKTGPIETEYSEGIATSGVPIVRTVQALLSPLLEGGSGIRVLRA